MKKLLRSCVILIIFSMLSFQNYAQNIAIGSWRDHPPFREAIEVAEDNNGLIYCATQYGLFAYSKSNGELTTLSRLKELSDLEIATIRYDRTTGILLVAYENSNIDLIYDNKNVVNLPDIKQKSIIGGKHINSVFFLNRSAYLSCEFGIVVIDLDRKEIKDTYYIGPNGSVININGLAFDGTYMIAATDSGIFKANYSDPNIFNYTAWNLDTTLSEPHAVYSSVTSLNGKFYTVKSNPAYGLDSVLVYDNGQWRTFINDDTEGGHIDSYNGVLIYRNAIKISSFNTSGSELKNVIGWSYPYADIRRGFVDAAGNFWIADNKNGLVWQSPDSKLHFISPNGPGTESAWAMAGSNGTLWVASGAISGDSPVWEAKNGIYRYSDNEWRNYDCRNDTVYGGLCAVGLAAVNCVAIDPENADHAFIGSWGKGVLEYYKEGGVKHYNEYNSTLHHLNADAFKINVGGLTFDTDGNLWVVDCGTLNSVSVMKRDKTWQDFTIPETALTEYSFYNLVVDDFGQKWFCARQSSEGKGLCVFKEANLNTPYNASFKRLTDHTGTGGLPDIYVRSIAKDKDGSIWLGTDQGVAVIYNPGNVFTGGNYDAQRIIIQQDGYNQYLLETEIVSSIVVDGANRKWFGTYSGGAFLMSADGTKQLLNFNKDNSPLASNTIMSIAIDDKTGEVFFATDKGIISYRGDATKGGDKCNDYYVFPNPVRHEYHGPIAIRGLVENADVKIADVAGNVVYHTKANGGEAIWNGNNFKGERAQTGVYIVYITNDDGSETCTTKMLFSN